MKKINVGVIGCGKISGIYFTNLAKTFDNTNVYACADLIEETAKKAAEEWNLKVMSVDEMLACDDIQIILNITTPQSHYSICKLALEAGKHVYVEKPLSLSIEEGTELVALAKEKGLLLGCAPDTFMGAAIQTCRKIIDDGFIGTPIGATAFMLCRGHESWHPAPEFYYKKGGGPMFDMGPYYLTAMINLLGGVREVFGMNAISFPTRTITSEALNGTIIDVEVPTHVAGIMRFDNGAIGTIITSFDVTASKLPKIEIYGSKGTLVVPDPNCFGEEIFLATRDGEFKSMPFTHIYAENSRGLGVADMAQCIIDGATDNKASGELANHVLEIMCALHTSNDDGVLHKMSTKYTRTAPVSPDLVKGIVR